MWEKIGNVSGTPVEGDKTVPPTRWWNHWFLALFGWRTIVTFRVPLSLAQAGYCVGFTPIKGSPMYNTKPCHSEYFSVRVGHEDCMFFARPINPNQPPYSPVIVARSRLY